VSLKESIRANLAAFPREEHPIENLRHAAVAILISPTENGPAYALTRRALTMRRGAGNYALPGGHLEPGEDVVEAAIREAHEELGILATRDAFLGLLDDFVTLSGHVVTPVVLWLDEPVELKPDPTEVGHAWLYPLTELDHPDSPMSEAHPDGGEPILRMYAGGSWINPPTAAFLLQFREVALHGRHTRVKTIGQPNWTAN
jgi:8-oxo-dGTP pyrophosphatase MutT (NUDIX family)